MQRLRDQLATAHALSPLSEAWLKIDAAMGGAFTYEDAPVFSAALAVQPIGGDLLEIGVLNGKTAAVLSLCLRPGERLHLCDLFETVTAGVNDAYDRHPGAETIRADIVRANPDAEGRIALHAMNSAALDFAPASLRFVHVDGDHGHAGCLRDLRNAWRWLKPHGLLAVDDVAHPKWPEVSSALNEFIAEAGPVSAIDFNRRGAQGRKTIFRKDGA